MYKILSQASTASKVPPTDANVVVFSELQEFYYALKGRSFTIRYVMDGCEHYTLNGNRYAVKQGDYLLANQFAEGHVEVNSKKPVRGLCIGIGSELVSEVFASISHPDTAVPDISLDNFFNSTSFLENQYAAGKTALGGLLIRLAASLKNDPYGHHRIGTELFFAIAEKIVADSMPVYRQLQLVPGIKQVTKGDLMRKLLRGKACMDEQFAAPLDVLSVARESGISEYHFFRLFKSVYGLTPYHYLVKLRLEHAHRLLTTSGPTVSDAAFESGFSDIFSFSKAFKKHFGVPPSSVLPK